MAKEELVRAMAPIIILSGNSEAAKKIKKLIKERQVEEQMAILNYEKSMNESKEKFEALRKRLIKECLIKKENQ